MLAVCMNIIFHASFVYDGRTLPPFSRGERSLEVDLDHGYCS